MNRSTLFSTRILWGVIYIGLGLSLSSFGNQKHASTTEKFPSKVIEFPKGSSDLTPEMRQTVNDFVTNVRKQGKVDEVYVAAWADQTRVGDKSLTEEQEELARRRGRNVRAYLEDVLKVDVDTFNMAKRTNLWGRLFNTEEARVKGQKPVGHDRVAWRIHDAGKPSAVVLVAELENPGKYAE